MCMNTYDRFGTPIQQTLFPYYKLNCIHQNTIVPPCHRLNFINQSVRVFWSPNLQHPQMRPYLETGLLQMSLVTLRSYRSRKKRKESEVAQFCPTLCCWIDYTVHGILQARILEWVAFPFSRGSSQPRSPALQACSSWATKKALQVLPQLSVSFLRMLYRPLN